MDSLFAYRSPLHDNPPQPGERLGQPLTRRVVIVLIDALRADTAEKPDVMPYLDELRARGASATMHSQPPSYSAPGYSIIFTGAWPDISDGPAINTEYEDMPTWTQDNLFSAAHRLGLKTAVSGYNFFERLIPQEAVSDSFYTAGEDAAADREVLDAALPWLEGGEHQLVLIHIDQVDYAGHHEGGPIDPRWDEAATRADELVREIASHLDLEQDTLLVFSDHGQIDRGGHGGHDPITLIEPFIAAGKGIKSGDYGDVQMVDLAPTIAALLGTNIPASAQGRILTDMLSLPPGQDQAILESQSYQQVQLANAYTEAIGRPIILEPLETDVEGAQAVMSEARAARLTSERIPRFIVIFLLFGFISFLLWKNWNRNFLWMFIGAIVYALLFHFRYAVIGGWTYSMSSITGVEDLIGFIATTAFVSLAIPWWVLFTYLGVFKLGPRRAAEITFELTFAVMLLLALPVFWNFALNGALIKWTLPDMSSMYIGFLCLLQILVVAALGIPLSGVTALVVWFQKWLQPAPVNAGKRK